MRRVVVAAPAVRVVVHQTSPASGSSGKTALTRVCDGREVPSLYSSEFRNVLHCDALSDAMGGAVGDATKQCNKV